LADGEEPDAQADRVQRGLDHAVRGAAWRNSELRPAASLRLLGTKPTITGVIIATYRPAGSVQDKEEQP